jgi:hypothetical protein
MTIDSAIDEQLDIIQDEIKRGITSGSFILTDASGVNLVLSNVSAYYYQIGPMVYFFGKFTYPTTVSTSLAAFTLPIPSGLSAMLNCPYGSISFPGPADSYSLTVAPASTSVQIWHQSMSSQLENTALSTYTAYFTLFYPIN